MHKSCPKKVLYNIQGNLIVDNKLLTSSISGNDAYLNENMGSAYVNENNNNNTYKPINDYDSEKYKGKGVVLVDSDNPWYLNDDESIPWPQVDRVPSQQSTKVVKNVIVTDNKTTHVEEKEEEKSQTNIIFLLLIIFVILILYKFSSR